jgi:hypothetical protein
VVKPTIAKVLKSRPNLRKVVLAVLSSGSWTVGLASTDANKETAPALGGGERWGRYRCVRRAGGVKGENTA